VINGCRFSVPGSRLVRVMCVINGSRFSVSLSERYGFVLIRRLKLRLRNKFMVQDAGFKVRRL